MEASQAGDLDRHGLCCFMRRAVFQIGVLQPEDQFVLLCSPHREARAEAPPFRGHLRREVGGAGITLVYGAFGNSLKACKDSVANLIWNIIAGHEAESRCLHGVLSHGSILSIWGFDFSAGRLVPRIYPYLFEIAHIRRASPYRFSKSQGRWILWLLRRERRLRGCNSENRA